MSAVSCFWLCRHAWHHLCELGLTGLDYSGFFVFVVVVVVVVAFCCCFLSCLFLFLFCYCLLLWLLWLSVIGSWQLLACHAFQAP